MNRRIEQFGMLGSALGALAGLVELSVGRHILPWVGNKGSPEVLGLVTLLLSGVAFWAIRSSRTHEKPTNDGKLAILLGVLLPAAICFTTVGRLWYLPGPLLLVAALLLAFEYWPGPRQPDATRPVSGMEPASRMMGGLGSLAILVVFALAFWNSQFGLFQSDVSMGSELVRLEVVPMDLVQRVDLSGRASVAANIEVLRVMIVYLLLILGAVLGLFASLASSRLFLWIGGGIAATGLALFLVWLPGILEQAQYTFVNLAGLWGALGWGWYISALGAALALFSGLVRLWPARV